jgi:hypothetical protein
MCGGGAPAMPPDNSAEVARIEAAQAREAREAEERAKAEARDRFTNNLNSAYTAATGDVNSYFQSRGLNPDEYAGAISSGLTNARSRVPDLDTSPGTYFDNLGAQIYDSQTEAFRNRSLRPFNDFAADGFAIRRIGNDADDPYLDSVLETQFVGGDDQIRGMLDRGVITNSGYEKALADLEAQRAGARARLQDIGASTLEVGRGNLRDIASRGRQSASNLDLGMVFDPYSYQQEIDQATADFFASLGDNISATAPTDLFDTSGLAGIAGAASGAQNTVFDPNALAGNPTEEDDDEEEDEDAIQF